MWHGGKSHFPNPVLSWRAWSDKIVIEINQCWRAIFLAGFRSRVLHKICCFPRTFPSLFIRCKVKSRSAISQFRPQSALLFRKCHRKRILINTIHVFPQNASIVPRNRSCSFDWIEFRLLRHLYYRNRLIWPHWVDSTDRKSDRSMVWRCLAYGWFSSCCALKQNNPLFG